MDQSKEPRTFVPLDLDCSDWSNIRPYFDELARRALDSPAAVRQWLEDLSQLSAVVDEFGTRRYIDQACHTDDAAIERRFLDFVEKIEPKLKPAFFKMQKRFVECPHRGALGDAKFGVMEQRWRADVELYRDENVPLETQVTKLITQYDKACGQMLVEFRGQSYTLQQLARFLEEPDRATRQEAWQAGEARRAKDREELDRLFDQLLQLRGKIARNAGLKDFREYAWRASKRFDYTPDDCRRFAEAVAETCLPVVEELNRQRKADLGVQTLRPWDMAVDPKGRDALRPFSADDPQKLVEGTENVLRRVAPDFAKSFRELRGAKTLDLESRKGKRPGGFQATLPIQRQPFIFMNAAGLQRDVETMLHEFGHALHTIESRVEPLLFLSNAPMEFAEVASMSMELLGATYLEEFYSEADAQRARRGHLEGIIRLMPWIATIDSFQHWLYTHEGCAALERGEAWLRIWGGLSSGQLDWRGHEDVKRFYWQRQLHLFHAPFYYIEYGIAQLGALGVWLNHRRQGAEALAAYRRALALGGTRPLPRLFEAAGLKFDFSARTLGPLMREVGEELARLPS